MGGSGSRLSKELLAEYQVRGALVLAELACGPAQGSGVREQVAGRPWLSGRLQTLVWICLSGPDVPDQAGDPPVSATLTPVLQLGIAVGRALRVIFLAGQELDASPPRAGPCFRDVRITGSGIGGTECKSRPRPCLTSASCKHFCVSRKS